MEKINNVFEFLESLSPEAQFSKEDKIFIETMAKISAAILEYRKIHGLSQNELAKQLGISQPALSKIESGKNISIKTLAKIVAKLDGRLEIKLDFVHKKLENKIQSFNFNGFETLSSNDPVGATAA